MENDNEVICRWSSYDTIPIVSNKSIISVIDCRSMIRYAREGNIRILGINRQS